MNADEAERWNRPIKTSLLSDIRFTGQSRLFGPAWGMMDWTAADAPDSHAGSVG
jgi:hypothetical protein